MEGFYADKRSRDGRQSCCKLCQNKATSAWWKANPERAKKINAKWYRDNPERKKEQGARWYKENLERKNKTSVAWAKAHPELVRAVSAKWHRDHPELCRIRASKRRALKKAYQGQHYTVVDVAVLFEQQEGLCAYCHEPLASYHVDHIVPLSRGGGNGADNICLACPACNMSKSDKLLGQEWCACSAHKGAAANG